MGKSGVLMCGKRTVKAWLEAGLACIPMGETSTHTMRTAVVGGLMAAAFLMSCTPALADDLGNVVRGQQALSSKDAKKKAIEENATSLTLEADKIAEDFTFAFYKQTKQAGVSFIPMDGVGTKHSADMMTSETIQASANREITIVRSCLLADCRENARFIIAQLNMQGMDVYFDNPDGSYPCDPVSLSCKCRLEAFDLDYSLPCKQFFDPSGRDKLRKKVIDWMSRGLAAAMRAAQAEN